MGYSYVIMILLGVGLFFGTDYAFANTTIETADNDLATPGCLDTAVGCYTPNVAVVDVGDIITMINTDDTGLHTFTAGTVDGFTPTPSGIFDSGILNAGDSFEYTTDTAGEIPYYCMLHVWMQGTIIVQEAEPEPEPIPPTIFISTNKLLYANSSIVTISGNINNYDSSSNYAITYTVTSPENKRVGLGQI
ncbi:MAG: hypothetical protein IIA83_02170, partial [Thaumarchaeota archaeon]|nr:hypothetical protein [Nitrososphaerota archaeon]